MNPAGQPSRLPPRPPDVELFPVLDRSWPPDGLGPIAVIVGQLPDPVDLRKGAVVVVRDGGPPPRGIQRLVRTIASIWNRPRRVHPAVRCTALLACGYRDISAAADPRTGEELVWGLAPTSDRSS